MSHAKDHDQHPALPELCAELLRRAALDQEARATLQATKDSATAVERCQAVDADNLAWIRPIIAVHGWPGRSLVGPDGAHAAWLLIQHAPYDTQVEYLPLLQAAVAAGEAEMVELAYLSDRVRVRQGRPQVYGTQWHSAPEGTRLCPVREPERVNERRRRIGLPPLTL